MSKNLLKAAFIGMMVVSGSSIFAGWCDTALKAANQAINEGNYAAAADLLQVMADHGC